MEGPLSSDALKLSTGPDSLTAVKADCNQPGTYLIKIYIYIYIYTLKKRETELPFSDYAR